MSKVIQLRIDFELLKRLDHASVDLDLYRHELVSALLERALESLERGEWELNAESKGVREPLAVG